MSGEQLGDCAMNLNDEQRSILLEAISLLLDAPKPKPNQAHPWRRRSIAEEIYAQMQPLVRLCFRARQCCLFGRYFNPGDRRDCEGSMNLLTYAKDFLELRLRAFVYALFALVGFIIGVIVTCNLTFALLEAAR